MHAALQVAGRGGDVAVKIMQSAGLGDEGQLDAFRREVQVLSALRHPHIVRLLGACLVLPHLCIVEELATGGSLYDKLHGPAGQRCNTPLPYSQVRDADLAHECKILRPSFAQECVLVGPLICIDSR